MYSAENQENPAMAEHRKIKGNIILSKLIPADLKLDNSYFSPKFPNTITDASITPIGKAIGTSDIDK